MARLPAQNMTPGLPAKPPGMSKAASAAWDIIVKKLTESNIRVAKAHGMLVEQAATIAADMEDARETVKIEGAYFTNPKTGAMQLHPAARRVDSLRRDYVKVLSLLGLRSAVALPTETGKSLEDILDG